MTIPIIYYVYYGVILKNVILNDVYKNKPLQAYLYIGAVCTGLPEGELLTY